MSERNPNDEVTQTVKVLIVDDSRMVRASIIKRIRDRFEFREEADGEAGWQTLLVDEIGRASCRKECRSRWSPYH